MRENSVCMKILCIQVIILFLEIEFKFSLHENSMHMSKYTIFRNWVQATQLDLELSSSWKRLTQSQFKLRIELNWSFSTQLNSNSMTDLISVTNHHFKFSSVTSVFSYFSILANFNSYESRNWRIQCWKH